MATSPSNSARVLAGLSGTVVLVGGGKMGGAMLDGWLALGLPAKAVAVYEPAPSPAIAALADKGALINPPLSHCNTAAAIVLAVKPQVAGEIVPAFGRAIGGGTVAISIMAGVTLAKLGAMLSDGAIVRAMPNSPAAIGRGITVAVTNGKVVPQQGALAHALLAATGALEWVDDEALIDAVTALSGSGPAYVFLLAEALAEAGIEAGLPPDLARKLARETVAGSGELLHRSPLDPATLRQNVTSPGGTTAAALDVLMGKDGLAALMRKAVAAAAKRSRELAG